MKSIEIINLVENFALKEDLLTYDPYDVWKTKIGLFIKRFYYKSKIGVIPAVLLSLFDFYINNSLRFFYKKQEYPIVRALAALSLQNTYQFSNDYRHLHFAAEHIDWLIKNASKTKNGIGWGLNFKWPVNNSIIYSADTPFSTHTPYVFEAIINHPEFQTSLIHHEVIEKVFFFFEKDIVIMYEDFDKMAISYGPLKDRIAVNAVSYGLLMYSYFYKMFPAQKEYILNKCQKMYNYINYCQGEEGGWYYSPDVGDSFIDCFHSCFIIQNLFKSNRNLERTGADALIDKGWYYIKTNFYDSSYGLYKRFTLENKPTLVKFDLYDNAEVLHTAVLLDDSLVDELIDSINKHFVKNLSIYSIILKDKKLKNKDNLRWAVMPLIYALSLTIKGQEKCVEF